MTTFISIVRKYEDVICHINHIQEHIRAKELYFKLDDDSLEVIDSLAEYMALKELEKEIVFIG